MDQALENSVALLGNGMDHKSHTIQPWSKDRDEQAMKVLRMLVGLSPKADEGAVVREFMLLYDNQHEREMEVQKLALQLQLRRVEKEIADRQACAYDPFK